MILLATRLHEGSWLYIPCRIRTVLIDDEVWVRIVLQTFAHLLTIPEHQINHGTVEQTSKETYAARTRPVTIKFFHGALPKRCVDSTRRV